jgi:hypothetical protein
MKFCSDWSWKPEKITQRNYYDASKLLISQLLSWKEIYLIN